METVETLKHLSTIKLAVVWCNDVHFKNVILLDAVVECCRTRGDVDGMRNCWDASSKFPEILENLTKSYAMPVCFRQKVMKHVERISFNMLKWCLHLTTKFNFLPKYCVSGLNESLFNSEGDIIDTKIVENIVNDTSLCLTERFKVACASLMEDQIRELWGMLSIEERDLFFSLNEKQGSHSDDGSVNQDPELTQQSHLSRLWAHYLTGRLHELPFWQNSDGQPVEDVLWRLCVEQALGDCNLTAVRFAWKQQSNRQSFGLETVLKIYTRLHFENRFSSFENILLVDMLWYFMRCLSPKFTIKFLEGNLRYFWYSTLMRKVINCHNFDFLLKTFTFTSDFLSLHEYESILCDIPIKSDCGKLFGEVWSITPLHFRKFALHNSGFIYHKMTNDDRNVQMPYIMEALSAEERYGVVFSKFEGDHYESGLFLIYFAAGYLMSAKLLAECCQSLPIDLKQQMKKELFYFANDLMFNVVTTRRLVQWGCTTSNKHWMCEKWQHVLFTLKSIDGLQEYNDFFQWCFTSQEEIIHFKKQMFLVITSFDDWSGSSFTSLRQLVNFKTEAFKPMTSCKCFYNITFGTLNLRSEFREFRHFVGSNSDLAERFLVFFDVKGSQLRILLTKTVIHFFHSHELLELISSASKKPEYKSTLIKIRQVMAVLKWCLIDKEMVLEIRDIFRNIICTKQVEGLAIVSNDFELAFEQRLQELDSA